MPTMIISKRGLKLSVKEAELFCSADLSKNPESLAEQRYIALKLAQIYETGRDDTNKDEWKAKKYLAQATDSIPVKHGIWSAETGFNLLGLFTTIRLNISRVNRALNLPFIGKAFLNRFFAIAGFSYFLELGIDLFLVTKQAYSAMPEETDEEKNRPFFTRSMNRCIAFFKCFNNALYEDGRIYRMLNAAIWGSLNMFLFFVATPLAVSINIAGFIFDIGNKFAQTESDVATHEWLHAKILSKVTVLEEQDFQLKRDLILLRERQKTLINDLASKQESKVYDFNQEYQMEAKIKDLADKITDKKHKLLHIQNDLHRRQFEEQVFKQKLDIIQKKRFTAMTMVTILLVGVVLYSIPGLNIGLVALGTAIVLAASVYSLSTKLWEYGKKLHAFCKNMHHQHQLKHNEAANEYKHAASFKPSSRHADIEDSKHFSLNQVGTSTSDSISSMSSSLSSVDHSLLRSIPPSTQLTSTTDLETTTQIKSTIRDKIEFIKSCQRKTNASAYTFAETFELFSKNEIQELKSIFNIKKDEQWNKQLKYWIKYSNSKFNPANYKNGLFYQCSFKESLRERVHEEREFGLMLDANETHLTERLREAQHQYQMDSKEEFLPSLESNQMRLMAR